MGESRRASRPSLGSDLDRVAEHVIGPDEYEELPELDDDMLRRGRVVKGGRPRSADPKKPISIRLPQSIIDRWRSSGPGWQTRMAEKLTRSAPK